MFDRLKEKTSMDHPSIIGIDLAKHSFQLHCAAADGSVLLRKRRDPLARGRFELLSECFLVIGHQFRAVPRPADLHVEALLRCKVSLLVSTSVISTATITMRILTLSVALQ